MRKKRKNHIHPGWLTWTLIVLMLVLWGCDGNSSDDDSADAETVHVLGDVWAMSYPTNIALQVADHTFIQALDADGSTFSFKCFGYKTDGEILADTLTPDYADITVVGHMASELPCKWPLEYYLRIGVCHQCANRALYYTGKTVAGARGYDFFVAIYGTYGDESEASYQQYSMQTCLDSAPDWQGDSYISNSVKNYHPEHMPEPIETEVQLYQTFRSYQAEKKPWQSDSDNFESYLETLFRMRIQARLGDDFPERSISTLLDIQKSYRKLKKELDRDMLRHAMASETVFDHYTSFFNEMAEAYKTVLTPLEYEQLFNLGYHEPIDLVIFNQRSPEMDRLEQ